MKRVLEARMSGSWYALHVKPRFEKCVSGQLSVKGYETFLPSYISKRNWSDRVKELSLPLFPGYVFCRFDVHARLPILVTPGVVAIVGVGKTPSAIEESEILAVQQVIGSGLRAQRWPYLNHGEMVRVEAGPLEGLTGIVVRMKGCDQLVVSISLLMRSVSVEIDRRSVKPLVSYKAFGQSQAENPNLIAASNYNIH
jgi:transcription antitermination factor NusG